MNIKPLFTQEEIGAFVKSAERMNRRANGRVFACSVTVTFDLDLSAFVFVMKSEYGFSGIRRVYSAVDSYILGDSLLDYALKELARDMGERLFLRRQLEDAP